MKHTIYATLFLIHSCTYNAMELPGNTGSRPETIEQILKKMAMQEKPKSELDRIKEIIQKDDVKKFNIAMKKNYDPSNFIDQNMLLTYAILQNANKITKTIICKFDADITKENRNSKSPLTCALLMENYKIAHRLLDHDFQKSFYLNGLLVACIEKEKYLEFKINEDIKRSGIIHNNPPPYLTKQIEWLLAHGASPDSKIWYTNAIQQVAYAHDHSNRTARIFQLLCAYGAQVNFPELNDETPPIHYVSMRAEYENPKWQILSLEYLISAGADVNTLNKFKQTPLHQAVEHNELPDTPLLRGMAGTGADLIMYLLYKGANRDQKDWEGRKPIDLATRPEIIEMLKAPRPTSLPASIAKILAESPVLAMPFSCGRCAKMRSSCKRCMKNGKRKEKLI